MNKYHYRNIFNMRRRPRIDLGQKTCTKEQAVLDRKRQRWLERNRDRPEDNPFIKAIKPDLEHYGEPDEKGDELKARLNNLEYGNYPGYFNYRNKAATSGTKATESQDNDDHDNGHGRDECEGHSKLLDFSDQRLLFFKEEWFKAKNVLDIGCNRGHITYAIARLFSPKSIVGIDIDLKMINMANRDIHLHLEGSMINSANELRLAEAAKLKLEGATSLPEDDYHFPLASYISHGPISLIETLNNDNADKIEVGHRFPNNIVFLEHNYVLATDELVEKQKPHFDTILCLSVTKWIHLNYRDDGLRRFFRRIYKHLKPGGLLILEAQPFDNYSRKKKLSERLKANYYSIKFKPDQFDAYLLSDQVGFKQILHETVTQHECVGFKRPMKVFLK